MSGTPLPCFTIRDKPEAIRRQLLIENPRLASILATAQAARDLRRDLRGWMEEELADSPEARTFYRSPVIRRLLYESLRWNEIAAIRILDSLDHSGRTFEDPNLARISHHPSATSADPPAVSGRFSRRSPRRYSCIDSGCSGPIGPTQQGLDGVATMSGEKSGLGEGQVVTRPFGVLFDSARGPLGDVGAAFWLDMLQLFRQLNGTLEQILPEPELVELWMARHPSGLDRPVIELRHRNRDRILKVLRSWIERGKVRSDRYRFSTGLPSKGKLQLLHQWWGDHRFHLKFAARNPEDLNELLGGSLSEETMEVLRAAREKGIPFFANPHYLSLINVDEPEDLAQSDLAIRDYVLYSPQLVEEFGHIAAWEKEDLIEPGRPNEAGWLLPSRRSVHRRYPDVAILIPNTMGRACGGLCTSCQRMYDFQRGNLNFDLEQLAPKEAWTDKLHRHLRYWEEDTQLRDILITGGDALMSSDRSLEKIFDAICAMCERKRTANLDRRNGEKYAELQRVRLGTRLPVYLPQRITGNLLRILADFKDRARDLGVRQFFIQTHFESAMEITADVRAAVHKLLASGWVVTNQQVFTSAASRRGHTARLRQVLNDIGVLPYYTFTVKGFRENQHNFAPSARVVQEQVEEKSIGLIPSVYMHRIRELADRPQTLVRTIQSLRKETGVPFLPTDRNVLNMPGVGKSMTFRCIGITSDGRRILQFDHDPTRRHSPILEQRGKVEIVESKSVAAYLDQVTGMGDDPTELVSIWGYSVGATEPVAPLYEYPGFHFRVTARFTNLRLPSTAEASKATSV
ncbi:MAG: KamA family protein [Pseudomonadota bacterium]